MLANNHQFIYNTYLHSSRTLRGKPFSPRKDFSDFDAQQELYLKRIQNFLDKYPHINIKEYFNAPYLMYPDTPIFDLKYFASMSAVNAYTMWHKAQRELPPDDDYQLEKIKNSLHFVAKFCRDANISVSEYPSMKTGLTYEWMKHLKNHQISIYFIMGFSGIYDMISGMNEEEKTLLIGDISKNYLNYKLKYDNSVIAKKLVTIGIEKIKEMVKK